MDFREMPVLMKEQKENGKKDKYIEITDVLTKAAENVQTKEEKMAYMQALMGTLEYMDFQIYELYRTLADCFKAVLRELLADYEALSKEEKHAISDAVKCACELRILLAEKYEAYVLEEK